MKPLIHRLFIVVLLIFSFSAMSYGQSGLLFKISQSGATASVDVILCLNGKGPLSCQRYHVSAQSLAIRTTINRSYPVAGIKIITPGYRAIGCMAYSNGYCLFAANGNTPTSLTLEKTNPSSYTVGGQVHGLSGTLVLENNGNEALTMSADGTFTFSEPLLKGSTYSVAVQSQPITQICTVTLGTGTITNANVTNVTVTCSTNTTTLSTSANTLVLSVTGRTEYGISGTPASGVSRVIRVSNSGSYDALDFQIDYSGLPLDTTHSGDCDGLSTLAHGTFCTIEINPGVNATSSNNGVYVSCANGTAPIAGTVEVSATNASSASTSVIVLDYGCIYQNGYVFAFDDTQGCPFGTCTGSVGGKVMNTTNLAAASPNGIVWASNGIIDQGSVDTLPGISTTSTTVSSNPTYATFSTFFATTYPPPDTINPFNPGSFSACNGSLDGQCNTDNILTFYNQFITNYVVPGPGPFIASAGPTPLTYYAAGLCSGLISGHSDWYLPAICELGFDRLGFGSLCGTSVTPTLQNIQSSLIDIAGLSAPAVPDGFFWSSTERASHPQTFGWYQNFIAGGTSFQATNEKANRLGVRCTRNLAY